MSMGLSGIFQVCIRGVSEVSQRCTYCKSLTSHISQTSEISEISDISQRSQRSLNIFVGLVFIWIVRTFSLLCCQKDLKKRKNTLYIK